MVVFLFRGTNDNVMDMIKILTKEEADVGNADEIAGPILHSSSEIAISIENGESGNVGNFGMEHYV